MLVQSLPLSIAVTVVCPGQQLTRDLQNTERTCSFGIDQAFSDGTQTLVMPEAGAGSHSMWETLLL